MHSAAQVPAAAASSVPDTLPPGSRLILAEETECIKPVRCGLRVGGRNIAHPLYQLLTYHEYSMAKMQRFRSFTISVMINYSLPNNTFLNTLLLGYIKHYTSSFGYYREHSRMYTLILFNIYLWFNSTKHQGAVLNTWKCCHEHTETFIKAMWQWCDILYKVNIPSIFSRSWNQTKQSKSLFSTW